MIGGCWHADAYCDGIILAQNWRRQLNSKRLVGGVRVNLGLCDMVESDGDLERPGQVWSSYRYSTAVMKTQSMKLVIFTTEG